MSVSCRFAATVGVVEQQFRGHVLKLAGDRTFEPAGQ